MSETEATSTTGETGGEAAFGLDPNLASALACFFGWTIVVPALFWYMSDDEFTKFYSMQSLLLSIVALVLSAVLIGSILYLVHLFLAWKAFNGEEWEMPVLGGFARDYA